MQDIDDIDAINLLSNLSSSNYIIKSSSVSIIIFIYN